MRTVSFVDHIEYEFQGNICSKAIGVGDVDNDQINELVIGNIHGDLHVYKGPNTEPWRKCSDLGTITCVEVGDVCNHGINYMLTSCLEGWCHVFTVRPDVQQQDVNGKVDESARDKAGHEAGRERASHEAGRERASHEAGRDMKPTHRQHLFANSRYMAIADINGDGLKELVIGYSDRCVRSYRWLDMGKDVTSFGLHGKFVLLETWTLAGQLSSMTVHKHCDGTVDMMVSQPGGTFVTLVGKEDIHIKDQLCGEVDKDGTLTRDGGLQTRRYSGPSLVFHPLGSARARNTGVTTEVVGNISRRKRGQETKVPSYCAICTLDGTLTLLDDDEKILWSIYVDHQLFTLQKLDVTGDGTEEVVACSSDGHTYIVNLNRDVVRFHFDENVAAFCAGNFGAVGSQNVPCLIYVTFNNRIVVYYDIQMAGIGSTNLMEVLKPRPELQELMNYFNCDPSKPDQVRKLYHWCLYGVPATSH